MTILNFGLKGLNVRILTSKVNPHTARIEIFVMDLDAYNIGIQIKQEELTNHIINMMISHLAL